MNDLIPSVSNWLWDYYLLATGLLAAVLLVAKMIQQPARRAAIHWATAGGLALLALLCAIPDWSILHMTSPPPPEVISWTEQLEPVTGPAIQIADLPQESQPSAPAAIPLTADELLVDVAAAERIVVIDYGILVAYAIGVGSLVSLAWLALGAWQVHRLRAGAEAPCAEIQNLIAELTQHSHTQPTIGISKRLSVAVAVGLLRPMVLLPKSLTERSEAYELRTVLAHELAHIGNRDLWLLAIVRSLLPLLWVHPLYWLWRRGLRLDQETLADAVASEQTSKLDYADQLVNWANAATSAQAPRFASSVGLWESPSQLKRRVAILLDEKLTVLAQCSRKWRWGSIVTLTVLAAGLSLITLQPEEVIASGENVEHPSQPDNVSRTANQKELVDSYREIYKKVEALHKAGGAGGETHKLLLARYYLQSSTAELLERESKPQEAVHQYAAALKSAEDYVESLEDVYDSGQVPLKELLDSKKILAEAERNLKQAKNLGGTRSVKNPPADFFDWLRVCEQNKLLVRREPPIAKILQKLPANLAVHSDYRFQVGSLLKNFGGVFDQQVGYPGAFAGVLAGLENDPYGPRVKVGSHFADHLSGELAIVTRDSEADKRMPTAWIIAAQLERMEPVAATIDNYLEFDENAALRRLKRRLVWHVNRPGGQSYFACVELGHLLVSNSRNLIESLLKAHPLPGPNTKSLHTGAGNQSIFDLQFDPAKETGIGNSLTEISESDPTFALVPVTSSPQATVADSESLVYERANQIDFADDLQSEKENNRVTVELTDPSSFADESSPITASDPLFEIIADPDVAASLEEVQFAQLTPPDVPSDLVESGSSSNDQKKSNTDDEEIDSLDLRLGPTVPSDPGDVETSTDARVHSRSEKPDFQKLLYPLYKALEKNRKPNTIVGICIDEFGRLLPDVDVRLYSQPVGQSVNRETSMVARTKSNAQGNFMLTNVIDVAKLFPEGIPNSFAPQKQQHICRLIGKLPGRVPGEDSDFAASIAKSGTTTVWVMQKAQTLRGRITDLKGKPVRGATVKVGLASTLLGSNDLHPSSTVSDAQGNYSISDLPRYDATDADRQIKEMLKKNPELAGAMAGGAPRQQLLVTHPKFAAQRVPVERIPSTVNARLQPGSTIEGKVTFPSGEAPTSAGLVYLQREMPSPKPGEKPEPYSFQVQSTKLDAEGRYRFESLPAGTYHLSAGVPNWVTLGIENVVTRTGQTTTAPNIALTRGGRVRVQLLDEDGKPLHFDKPITGWINPQRVPREKVFSHTSNVRTFSVEGIGETQLASGTYRVNVNVPTGDGQAAWIASGFADLRSTEDLEKISTIEIIEGQTLELQIRTKKWNPQSRTVLSSVQAITENGDVVEVEEHEGEEGFYEFAPVQQTVPSVSAE